MADPSPSKPIPTPPGPVNRFIQAVFWPISVWPSFGHMAKHGADDYVERTSPIMGTAVGFWICAGGIVLLYLTAQAGILTRIEVDGVLHTGRGFSHGTDTAMGVMLVFLPVLYLIGFWMFASREEDYPN